MFCDTLREYRVESGHTQRSLAEAIGVPPVLISNIECGKRFAMDEKHLPALVAALGFDDQAFWIDRLKREMIISRLMSSGVLNGLEEDEIERIKWVILDRWVDSQVASGRFRDAQ